MLKKLSSAFVLSFISIVIFIGSVGCSLAIAEEIHVFGPKTYTPIKKGHKYYSETFSITNSQAGNYYLLLINGDGESISYKDCHRKDGWRQYLCRWGNKWNKWKTQFQRVQSATVILNNREIVSKKLFNKSVANLVLPL
ncbi:MAG: hypothetical protein KDD61_12560, partial [Bdellovibrionales bacterium]|nr:hypothetical protein [Bdellovibrionales bacterium]